MSCLTKSKQVFLRRGRARTNKSERAWGEIQAHLSEKTNRDSGETLSQGNFVELSLGVVWGDTQKSCLRSKAGFLKKEKSTQPLHPQFYCGE